ncbi:MAG: OsmC family protein [Thermodesulfovibrionia bacterium]|nr:OsmC family protein [Thermodesulfovibrionia bacterium]MCK5512475.1 OsmC family protein [Thermodesulfovibrionia bacterium]
MAKSKITFTDGMQFVGVADSGHAVVMDAPASVGGNNTGANPMELLLMAFGGCSGMDVISILRKKKQNVSKLELDVEGEMAKDHPHMYTSMHIEYMVTGKNISEDAVKRAIELSLEKYCSVGATLGKAAKITHSYKVISD